MKTTDLYRIKTFFFGRKMVAKCAAMTAVLCLTAACTREEVPAVDEPADGEQTVTLGLQLQELPNPTRAITQEDIYAIKTLDVLAFKFNGQSETFDYAVQAQEMPGNITDMGEGPFRYWSAKLRIAPDSQRFVLLANCREQVSQFLSSPNLQGSEKYAMLSQLRYTTTPGTPWNTTSSTNYTPLPMWGETRRELVTSETWRLSAPSRMIVAVASLVVEYGYGTPSIGKFVLKSAHLFNTNTAGQIVPAPATVVDQTATGAWSSYVSAPTVPPELQPYSARYFGPVEYPATGTGELIGVSGMYVFEIDANQNPAQTFCVVLGGVYRDDTRTTYYRVDLVDGNNQRMRVAIRRHFFYRITLNDVTASGHATPLEAFNSRVTSSRSSSAEAGTISADLSVVEPQWKAIP